MEVRLATSNSRAIALARPAGLLVASVLLLSQAATSFTQELPPSAPAPALRDGLPARASETGDDLRQRDDSIGPIPIPEPRPEDSGKPGQPTPSTADGSAGAPSPGSGRADTVSTIMADPRSLLRPDPSGSLPVPEAECRRRLAALGAEFGAHAAEYDAKAGCSMPYPLILRSFGQGIALEPGAAMSCQMAEAAVRFVQEVAVPAAQAVFGQELKSVSQASAYVCRPRHGGRKLSEHAFGNALDIAFFTLADGSPVAVELQPQRRAADFLGRLRRSACGPFSTVLGPGSDADHATHLHFDLQPRRSGSFCQ